MVISSYSPTGNPKTVTFTDSAGRSYSVSTYKMVRRLGLRSYRYGFEGSGSSQPAPTVPSEDISAHADVMPPAPARKGDGAVHRRGGGGPLAGTLSLIRAAALA